MREKLTRKQTGFAQIKNEVLTDSNLTWKAKGLFAYLYSKPDDWDFSGDRITNDGADGRRAVYEGLKELESSGYLTRRRQPDGKMEYFITYEPDVENSKEAQAEPIADFSKEPKPQSAEIDSISNKDSLQTKNLEITKKHLREIEKIDEEIKSEFDIPKSISGSDEADAEKISLTPPPQPTYKKTPRAFANQRRAEVGKPPLQPKMTQKQLDTFGALKLARYYREKAQEFHGLTFLAHGEDLKQIESTNGKLRKLMLAFFRRCDYDEKKAHDVIDFYLDLEGEWCGYMPENCFKNEVVAKFENKDNQVKQKGGGKTYGKVFGG